MKSANRDNLTIAISAVLVACLSLSLGDSLIKQQSASFVIWQIFLVRSAIAIPFLIYFVRIRSCDVAIKPVQMGWTLLRSLILVCMWVFYFVALPHIELAVAAAAYYTLPLFIMLFAAIFLSETITARGWLAVVLGFIGTLLILQPQADDFNAYALLPVVAAICYACAMIMTRSKCRHEQPVVLSLWLNVSFVSVGALALLVLYICDLDAETQALNPFLLGEWTPMWLDEWRIMALLAIAFVVGSIGAAIAYQKGPPSIIAIYDYSYVAFAIVWGVLIFAEIPASLVTAGIVMIVAAGIVSIRQRST